MVWDAEAPTYLQVAIIDVLLSWDVLDLGKTNNHPKQQSRGLQSLCLDINTLLDYSLHHISNEAHSTPIIAMLGTTSTRFLSAH